MSSSDSPAGRRFLFVCNALQGHLNPMLPLALAARAAGHAVVFATGPDLAEQARQQGFEAWPVGPTHQRAGGNQQASWLDYFAATAEARAAELLPLAADWRPHVVIYEETELSGPVVAAHTAARAVVHGLGRMPPQRLWPFFTETVSRLGARWGLPGAAQALADAPYLHLCPPSLHSTETPPWGRVLPLRPSSAPPLPGEQLPAAFERLPWPRTILLTMGTVFNARPGVLEQALDGLLSLPANLVVTLGADQDPARFGTQPQNVLMTRYVSNALLLPRCDLVVAHGGAGTLFGALAAGLPSLLLPQGADQFINAEAALASGAALVLEPAAAKAPAIAAAARRLLDDPSFSVAARRVQAEIRALPDATAVLARL